ncbi:MAG: ATP synthase F1 subunit delta [Anaeroplasmataceae bacterium]
MIALEYAKSLFELASISTINQIDEELAIICQALEDNPDAMKIFTYPNISSKNKKEIVNKITVNCNELLIRFLYVLVDNDRFSNIQEIKDEFHKLVINQASVIEVVVTSAKELTEEQMKKIKSVLLDRFNGKEIKINNIVDANVIGGFKAVALGEQIDLTIKNKLDTLKASL